MYELGLLLGICVGAAVGIALVALLFKKRVLDCTFDERQERVRGRAFKRAFFTLVVTLFVYGFLELTLGRWCDTLAGVTVCIAVSMTVFAINCIVKDAYISLVEKPRQVMTLFTLLTAFNLGIGALYALNGELVEDGILTFRAVNPIVGTMTLVVLVVYIVNFLLREKEEAE